MAGVLFARHDLLVHFHSQWLPGEIQLVQERRDRRALGYRTRLAVDDNLQGMARYVGFQNSVLTAAEK